MPSILGMMIGTLANIILDPIFIFALNLGIAGAAIATVIGNCCALAYYIWFYLSKKAILTISIKYLSKYKTIWKEIFFIGTPAALSQFLLSIALIILNNFAKNYGDNALAGMGVSSKLMFFGTFIFMGFAAGCQPLIGFNYGAKNYLRVKEIFLCAMKMTLVIGVVLFVIFWFLAKPLVSIFTPINEIIEIGSTVLRISIFSFLVLGPQMLSTTGIQALGKAKEALILSIARQGFFYIPLIIICGKAWGFTGLIAAQPIADLTTLCLGLFFYGVS